MRNMSSHSHDRYVLQQRSKDAHLLPSVPLAKSAAHTTNFQTMSTLRHARTIITKTMFVQSSMTSAQGRPRLSRVHRDGRSAAALLPNVEEIRQ